MSTRRIDVVESLAATLATMRDNPLRTSLAALAMAAAVATIVVTVSALDGLAEQARATSARAFGSDTFVIANAFGAGLNRRELAARLERNPAVTRVDLRFLDRFADSQVLYAAIAQRGADVTAGGRTFDNASVNGAGAALADIRDIGLARGRFFSREEDTRAAQVVVVGSAVADALWIVAALAALVPMLVDTIRDLLHREAGVDVIAILALIGAFAFGEYLAGAVIGVMLATGAALEDYAAGRAERELTALVQRAPRIAHRIEGTHIVDVPVEQIAVGDRLLVKEADAIPVDGVLAGASAVLDESALTGESRLVEREHGDQVLSGTVNAGAPFEMLASTTAEASTYAGIVRLVAAAQERKAPFVRLADRYAAA